MKVLLNMMNLMLVTSHGFFMGPISCKTKELLGKVRNYKSISYNIDSLRNPSKSVCRGAAKEAPKKIDASLKSICFGLAISKGAEHIGPCSMEFVEHNRKIKVGKLKECVKFSKRINKKIPMLVTGDMHMYELEFKMPKLESKSRGYFRWHWVAKHTTPNEEYENCFDVIII